MFKVASEINKSDDINTNTYSDNRKEDSNNITNNYDNNGPNFLFNIKKELLLVPFYVVFNILLINLILNM